MYGNYSDDGIDIDIDGRDSNGNMVGGYGSCYRGREDDYDYDPAPPRKRLTHKQINDLACISIKHSLQIRREELMRFEGYEKEYRQKAEKWANMVATHKAEIASLEDELWRRGGSDDVF